MKNKYKNYLIVLDNAGSHRNNYVKNAITNSGNKYLFSVPYTLKTNPIENYFNQIKNITKQCSILIEYDNSSKKYNPMKDKYWFYNHNFNNLFKNENMTKNTQNPNGDTVFVLKY